MIASSHSSERKVYQVAELNQQLRELRSEFVDIRKTVMQKKMESNVAKKMEKRSIGLSDKRPYKITIKSQ
jgi:regulator of replication initiation timing